MALPLDLTVPYNLPSATRFLYIGATAVPFEMDPSAIEPRRTSVVSGLMEAAAAPQANVRATIHDHPEYGFAVSRAKQPAVEPCTAAQ